MVSWQSCPRGRVTRRRWSRKTTERMRGGGLPRRGWAQKLRISSERRASTVPAPLEFRWSLHGALLAPCNSAKTPQQESQETLRRKQKSDHYGLNLGPSPPWCPRRGPRIKPGLGFARFSRRHELYMAAYSSRQLETPVVVAKGNAGTRPRK